MQLPDSYMMKTDIKYRLACMLGLLFSYELNEFSLNTSVA